MRAQKCMVTVSTYEVEGDDLDLKSKVKTKMLKGTTRGLADSTVEIDAIRHNNWFGEAKKRARANALNGVIYSESIEYWVESEEEEKKPKKAKKAKKETLESPEAPKSDIQVVRDEYEEVLGKKAFNGWKIDVLKEKIAEFKNQ